jgi:hypothetical protein
MVELQFVVLAVAGSSPVGRPPPLSPLKRFSPPKVWADCGQLAIRKAISEAGTWRILIGCRLATDGGGLNVGPSQRGERKWT